MPSEGALDRIPAGNREDKNSGDRNSEDRDRRRRTAENRPIAHGGFNFYGGDKPWLHFCYKHTNFYIDFDTVEYCIPLDDRVIFPPANDEDDTEEYKHMQDLYGPTLKNLRVFICELNGVVSRLQLHHNCDDITITYGGKNRGHLDIKIPKRELNTLTEIFDTVFRQGMDDSDGDFVQIEDREISCGVSTWTKMKVKVYKYKRRYGNDEAEEELSSLSGSESCSESEQDD